VVKKRAKPVIEIAEELSGIDFRRAVILFSGGIDSTLMAEIAKENDRLGLCLFVNYDQPAASQEYSHAHAWCERNNARMRSLSIGMDPSILKFGDGPRVVPGRNLALVSLGVHLAAMEGFGSVWYGATHDDARDYPDCKVGFYSPLSRLCWDTYKVRVEAPLANMTTERIYTEVKERGLDLDSMWSCYNPKSLAKPCGECKSCKRRSKWQ
jgi:7-cyano-7-deazaguanine synthase